MKKQNKKLSELSNVYQSYPQVFQSIPLTKGHHNSAKLISLLQNKLKKVITKNIVRSIIRKSGTENKIRIMIEAKDIRLANSIAKEVKRILKGIN